MGLWINEESRRDSWGSNVFFALNLDKQATLHLLGLSDFSYFTESRSEPSVSDPPHLEGPL